MTEHCGKQAVLTYDRGLVHLDALKPEVCLDAGQPLLVRAPAPAQLVHALHLRHEAHLVVQLALRPPVGRGHHAAQTGLLRPLPHRVQVHQRVLELPRARTEQSGLRQSRQPGASPLTLFLAFPLSLSFLLLLLLSVHPRLCATQLAGWGRGAVVGRRQLCPLLGLPHEHQLAGWRPLGPLALGLGVGVSGRGGRRGVCSGRRGGLKGWDHLGGRYRSSRGGSFPTRPKASASPLSTPQTLFISTCWIEMLRHAWHLTGFYGVPAEKACFCSNVWHLPMPALWYPSFEVWISVFTPSTLECLVCLCLFVCVCFVCVCVCVCLCVFSAELNVKPPPPSLRPTMSISSSSLSVGLGLGGLL